MGAINRTQSSFERYQTNTKAKAEIRIYLFASFILKKGINERRKSGCSSKNQDETYEDQYKNDGSQPDFLAVFEVAP